REQSEYAEMLLRMVPSAVYTMDNHMRITGWNDMAEAITGYKAEEVMGKSAENFHFHPCRENCRLFADPIVAPEFNITCKIRNKNGEVKYVLKNVDVIHNDRGEVIGRVECFDDITERVMVEDQLKDSELRLNLAIGSGRIGLWDWRISTGEMVYNEQWANMLGYKLEELLPTTIDTWKALAHPGDKEKSKILLERYLKGAAEAYEGEIRLRHKEGHWIWVLDRGRVTEWDKEGKPIRMIGTHIDITDRKRAEEELRIKEKLLSAVASSIKELIEERDLMRSIPRCFSLIGEATKVDRVYLFVNSYDEQGKGYCNQVVEWNSGVSEPQLDNPELQGIPFEEVGSFLEPLMEGEVFQGVVRSLKHDRTRELLEVQNILAIIVIPVFVYNKFWGFIGFDECKYERVWSEAEYSILSAFANSLERAVERSLIEEELEASKQSAEAANTLKSQFIANMSHEIRTPMHAILGYSSLMKETAKDEQSIKYLNSIQKAGNMLMNLINDILDLSKIESGKLELEDGYVDIRKLFEDIREVFSLRAEERNIRLEIHIEDTVPEELVLDEMRVRQILFNLVGNAVKFTEKGTVWVKAAVKKHDEGSNRMDLMFMVEDTGIGIPEDQQRGIFEPFKQTDGQSTKKYGGTGLGLSITKRLLDIMGGTIALSSRPNEGSTFSVNIPGVKAGRHETAFKATDIPHAGEAPRKDENTKAIVRQQCEETENKAICKEMLRELEDLERGLWQESRGNRMNNIRSFAEQLRDIGLRYDSREIISYCDTLQNYIGDFNLKKIRETLDKYPEIIFDYRSIVSKGGI
ncbi:MAG: PAS domain S-box protein, partial [Pseudomonadota bacterium]